MLALQQAAHAVCGHLGMQSGGAVHGQGCIACSSQNMHLKWAPTATRAPDSCPAAPSQTGRLHAELSALSTSAVKSTLASTTGLMFDRAHALQIPVQQHMLVNQRWPCLDHSLPSMLIGLQHKPASKCGTRGYLTCGHNRSCSATTPGEHSGCTETQPHAHTAQMRS